MAARTISGEGAIAVDGLKESLAGLKRARKDLPRVVTKVSRDLAKQIILPTAQSKWAGQDIKPSLAKKAVKVSATTKGAAIALKYATVPMAAGVEYGSKGAYPQFRQWRGNRFTVARGSSTGFVVQDAIRDKLPAFEEKWLKTVVDSINEAVASG